MTFTCPICLEIVVTHAPANASPEHQLAQASVELQRHVLQFHSQEAMPQLLRLSNQYSMALFVKLFTTTDTTVEEPRAQLFKACIDTLLQDWEFVAKLPEDQIAPSSAIKIVR